jgi:hypothetical protein
MLAGCRRCWCSWRAARKPACIARCSTGREAPARSALEVSEAVLGKLAAKDNPQTMLGIFEQRWGE